MIRYRTGITISFVLIIAVMAIAGARGEEPGMEPGRKCVPTPPILEQLDGAGAKIQSFGAEALVCCAYEVVFGPHAPKMVSPPYNNLLVFDYKDGKSAVAWGYWDKEGGVICEGEDISMEQRAKLRKLLLRSKRVLPSDPALYVPFKNCASGQP